MLDIPARNALGVPFCWWLYWGRVSDYGMGRLTSRIKSAY